MVDLITNLSEQIFIEAEKDVAVVSSVAFQNFIQFSLLFLAFTTVVLIYNSTIFPHWLNYMLERKYPIIPTKGNLVLLSTLGVGFCLAGSCLLLVVLFSNFSELHLLACCYISNLLWGLLIGALGFTTLDVLRVATYLFPL